MRNKTFPSQIYTKVFGLLAIIFLVFPPFFVPSRSVRAEPDAIQTPVLKWQRGGCYSSWCETGWYSSPAVADLDGDGQVEVVGSGYSIVSLNGSNGALEWRLYSGHDRSYTGSSSVGRTWPGIVIADVDGDQQLEIVTAHSGGYVSVYNASGYFEPGWPKQPVSNELRGLSVYDLDQDGTLEILVTAARGSQTNSWVYEHNGALRAGWPQLNNDSGYAWGVYNANASIRDLDGDNLAEIVVPSDVHYINAYEANGSQIPANPMYAGKGWGKVGVWESPEIELRGWGECDGNRVESFRTNFANGASLIVDVDRNGTQEVVVSGNVYYCIDGYPSQYTGIYIFNPDRSRFNQSGFNWTNAPTDTGLPISEDYNVIESAQPNPAAADLDGDGRLEILFPSYDGKVHAFWLDKSEHGGWPFSARQPGEGYNSFASEPVVADLDNNGQAEVIFTTWTQKSSSQTGKLYILSSQGAILQAVSLPAAVGGGWNGGLPAPTLANLDSDADLEIVINTSASGLIAYDLPGTANARILWGTGRGSFLRSGSILTGSLAASTWSVTPPTPQSGDLLHFTITLRSAHPDLFSASATETIPPGLSFAGNLSASSGTVSQAGGTVSWKGFVSSSSPVTIRFDALSTNPDPSPQVISYPALFEDGFGNQFTRQITVILNGTSIFLPVVAR